MYLFSFLFLGCIFIHYGSMSSEVLLHTSQKALISEYIILLHEEFEFSFVSISLDNIIEDDMISLDLSIFGKLQLPYMIIENKVVSNGNPDSGMTNFTSHRYARTSLHINPPLPITLGNQEKKAEASFLRWMKICRRILGLHCTLNHLMSKDIFLFTQQNNPHNLDLLLLPESEPKKIRKPLKFIWIHWDWENNELFKSQNHFSNNQGLALGKGIGNYTKHNHSISSNSKYSATFDFIHKSSSPTLIVVCSFCLIDYKVPLGLGHSITNSSEFNSVSFNSSLIAQKILKVSKRFTNFTRMHLLGNSLPVKEKESQDIMPVPNKSQGTSVLSISNGIVFNSLVFISRKIPSSHSISKVLGPLSMASWIGIVLAYTITAIVFGVVKALTINNLDESLYEYVMQHLLKYMNEDRVIRKNLGMGSVTIKATHAFDVESNRELIEGNQKSKICCSDNENNENHCDTQAQNHVRISKAILHLTIRIVSFVLIATYEGKLYNTITFPQPHLTSSIEDLVASDQYSIKVTREAGQNRNLGIQLNKFVSKENDTTTSLDRVGQENVTSTILSPNNGSYEIIRKNSVTIEDCINWVESSPDSNHACIGYEFELRNLHKTHRFDKLVAKSNRKLFKQGLKGYGGRRSSRLFPGAFQISKWIMESGIMQLWNLAESSFTDLISDEDAFNPSRMFTIKDYIGLFMVYFVLLFLSFVLFLSEFGVWWAKVRFKLKSLKDICNGFRKLYSKLIDLVDNMITKCEKGWRKLFSKDKVHRIIHC